MKNSSVGGRAISPLAICESSISRTVVMAWEDRTAFEAMEAQFGLNESAVIALMRRHMKPSSFRDVAHTDGRSLYEACRVTRRCVFAASCQPNPAAKDVLRIIKEQKVMGTTALLLKAAGRTRAIKQPNARENGLKNIQIGIVLHAAIR